MTLNAAIDEVLPALRAEALARMTSRCNIRRTTGRMVQDEDTGRELPEWEVVATDVPFRLAGPSSGAGGSRRVEVAGGEFQQATGIGHLPHDRHDLADGDLIDITTGEWAGSVYKVIEATKKDQATARRVPVVEVDRPEEWV